MFAYHIIIYVYMYFISLECSLLLPIFACLSGWIIVFIINLQAYSSLAPIIHIVNVGNAARESYANVTVSSY
jgi:hypothetical protein